MFGPLCNHLGTKNMTSTAYHPETNREIGHYNRTIVTRLLHGLAILLKDWYCFVQRSTYTSSTQAYRSTNNAQSRLVLERCSSAPITFECLSRFVADAKHATDPQILQTKFLAGLKALQKFVNKLHALA